MTDYQKGLVGYTNQRAPVKPQLPLADYEKDTIAYFFAKLKLTDQRFYTQAMPDEKTEQITKRDYANKLRYLTNEQIDKGINELRRLMAANHPEYKFMTIPKAIGLCDGTAAVIVSEGVQAGARKVFEPLALPDMTAMSKAKKAGRSELDRMRAMLDDKPEPKPLTPAEIAENERLEKLLDGRLL